MSEDQRRGLYRKYFVQRLTEEDAKLPLCLAANLSSGLDRVRPPRKHEECDYFVLDLVHDPYAASALRAYAKACISDYPVLARELISRAAIIERTHPTTKESK